MNIELLPASLVVDQDKINLYAEVTDDFNPIHVDPDFAATTPMGGIIAHGTMSLNLIWQSLQSTFRNVDWDGVDLDIRFLRPVRVGDEIKSGGRSRPEGGLEVWVTNQRDELVISGSLQLDLEESEPTAASART